MRTVDYPLDSSRCDHEVLVLTWIDPHARPDDPSLLGVRRSMRPHREAGAGCIITATGIASRIYRINNSLLKGGASKVRVRCHQCSQVLAESGRFIS